MEVERFEDLHAWKAARRLIKSVYDLTRQPGVARDFGFCNQIQRASTSIMSNIAEGFERYRPKPFLNHLLIAKGSCAEVRSLLYVALDNDYLEQTEFDRLMKDAIEVSKLIGGLISSVRRRTDE